MYEAAWSLGYSAPEVDGMELWQLARALGVGRDEPIVKGTRSIQLPSDTKDRRGKKGGPARGGSRGGRFRDSRLAAREAEWARRRRTQEPGSP